MSKILIIIGVIMMSIGISRIANAEEFVSAHECDWNDIACKNVVLEDEIKYLDEQAKDVRWFSHYKLSPMQARVDYQNHTIQTYDLMKNPALDKLNKDIGNLRSQVEELDTEADQAAKKFNSDVAYVKLYAPILKSVRLYRVLSNYRDNLEQSLKEYRKIAKEILAFEAEQKRKANEE